MAAPQGDGCFRVSLLVLLLLSTACVNQRSGVGAHAPLDVVLRWLPEVPSPSTDDPQAFVRRDLERWNFSNGDSCLPLHEVSSRTGESALDIERVGNQYRIRLPPSPVHPPDGVEAVLRNLDTESSRSARLALRWRNESKPVAHHAAHDAHGQVLAKESTSRRYRLSLRQSPGWAGSPRDLVLVIVPPVVGEVALCSLSTYREELDLGRLAGTGGAVKARLGNQYRSSLLLTSGEQSEREVELPPRSRLRFGFGLMESVEALTLRIEISDLSETREVFRATLVFPANAQWSDGEVDLSPWGGQVVTVRLSVEGSAGGIGLWAHPEILAPLPGAAVEELAWSPQERVSSPQLHYRQVPTIAIARRE